MTTSATHLALSLTQVVKDDAAVDISHCDPPVAAAVVYHWELPVVIMVVVLNRLEDEGLMKRC